MKSTLVSTEDLDTLFGWACNDEGAGETRYPGMSYEDGIKDVILWLQGQGDRPDTIE